MRVIHKQASHFLCGGHNSAKIYKTAGNDLSPPFPKQLLTENNESYF